MHEQVLSLRLKTGPLKGASPMNFADLLITDFLKKWSGHKGFLDSLLGKTKYSSCILIAFSLLKGLEPQCIVACGIDCENKIIHPVS